MVIIKQICFDPDSGRLILSDSDNNHFLCDLYGRKKPFFLPYISGYINGKSRKKQVNFSFESNPRLNDSHFIEYFPINRKFEGYSQFPRPLVPPFANIPNYEIKNSRKMELIEQLQKYFSVDKTKTFLELENDNKALDYLTADLNNFDSVKDDSQTLLGLIENTFTEFRQIYQYKLNVLHKDPIIKALKSFQNILINNKEMKIINGRRLKEPCNEIKNNNIIINTIIHRTGSKKSNKKIEFNTGRSFDGQLPLVLGKNEKGEYIMERKNLKYGEFLYKNQKNEEETKEKAKASPIKEEETKKNEEAKKGDKEEEENKKEEESRNISFVSIETQNELSYAKENIIPIKSKRFLSNSLNREIKLLPGFKEEKKKKTGILVKYKKPNLKTNGDLFFENIDLLKKVNPIAFKLQEQKDAYDLKQLTRKVNQNKINQSNSGYDIKEYLANNNS